MRAFTVRQPWAWAIVHGGKDVENRSRNIAGSYRGPVAIHAGLAVFQQGTEASRALRAAQGTETPTELAFGAIVGVANLWAVHEARPGCCPNRDVDPNGSRWAMADSWHLCLAGARPLAKPIPYRGALGLWTVPDELGTQLLAHLDGEPTHDRERQGTL